MSSFQQITVGSYQQPWVVYSQSLNRGNIQRVIIQMDNSPLTWREVIENWQQKPEFRALMTQILQDCPYPAFFWETIPILPSRLDQPWEFVLVNAPRLTLVSANPQPFAAYLDDSQTSISTFSNLGGDAILIAPRASGPLSAYTHFANFVRQAPTTQVDSLWQVLGQTLHPLFRQDPPSRTIPLWVSTSGLGVYWLHTRLDDFPKYYTYVPYRSGINHHR